MSKVSPLVSIYDVLKKAFDHSKYNTPIGTIHQFAGANSPDGWLFCKGHDLLKEDYPELYEVLGTTYGTPSDEDYFRLPDFCGRVPVGHNATGGSGLSERTLGEADGEEEHTLTVDEMPSHTHTHNSTNSLGLITQNGTGTVTGTDSSSGEPNVGASVTALTISSQGGGDSHNNMQPYLVVHYIIKYSHKYRTLEDVTYLPV